MSGYAELLVAILISLAALVSDLLAAETAWAMGLAGNGRCRGRGRAAAAAGPAAGRAAASTRTDPWCRTRCCPGWWATTVAEDRIPGRRSRW